jgi:hypothetical protein
MAVETVASGGSGAGKAGLLVIRSTMDLAKLMRAGMGRGSLRETVERWTCLMVVMRDSSGEGSRTMPRTFQPGLQL